MLRREPGKKASSAQIPVREFPQINHTYTALNEQTRVMIINQLPMINRLMAQSQIMKNTNDPRKKAKM